MYDVKPNLLIGFHGCERSVRDQLLMDPHDYKISQKPFDWLGHGLYSKYELVGKQLPRNKDLKQDRHKDKILRELDCAAIEFMHSEILEQHRREQVEKGYSGYKIFDSTRGVFTEGGPAFDGAGLFEKSHIQICIRNPNCIQGFFMPRKKVDFISWLGKRAV